LQCKASYDVHWVHLGNKGRCPRLVPTDVDRKKFILRHDGSTFKIQVQQYQMYYRQRDFYDSLADYWSQWNNQYMNADFPRLIIRFEDTLFHAETIVEAISECVGQPVKKPYKYFLDPAKNHGHSRDFVTAMSSAGSHQGQRPASLTLGDLEYARKALDPELMQIFHYGHPEVSNVSRSP